MKRNQASRIWFPISSGLLTPEHCEKIGPALCVFLWFVHHEYRPKHGRTPTGVVNDGWPITYDQIANDLGISGRTVDRHVQRLERGGYIRSERSQTAGHGVRYFVANPIRWCLSERQDDSVVSPADSSNILVVSVDQRHDTSIRGDTTILSSPIIGKQRTTNNKPSSSLRDDSDARHNPTRESIKQLHENKFKIGCEWDGSEAKALSKLLNANPSWTTETVVGMARNRFDSEDVTPERPRGWIPHLGKYGAGPLDRYGRQKLHISPSRPSADIFTDNPAIRAKRQLEGI